MSDKHRVEILERAIVKAMRAARKESIPEVIRALSNVEVDESKYPVSIPLVGKRSSKEQNSEIKPDE